MSNFSIYNLNFSKIGRSFFAIATIAFGVQNFIYQDFMMGRAPEWPSSMPGQFIWAYGSGVILFLLGLAILFNRKTWMAAIAIATLLLIWALFRHLLNEHWQWGAQITQTGKAWTLIGGALTVAATVPDLNVNIRLLQPHVFYWVGRVTLAAFMVICGIQHFMFVQFVKELVPDWIQGDVFWTYFGGVALIAGGLGLLLDRTLKSAALMSGIMVFAWFLILHIPMAVLGLGTGREWIAVVEALAVSGIAFMLINSNSKHHNT